MRIVLTVNKAWNIYNFRRGVVRALLEDGHELIVLAPRDETVPKLEALGCRFVDLPMDAKGLSPLRDLKLMWEFRRHFRALSPDAILSYTIKNNVYGGMAAARDGIPFIPNVTGLGTAFLSGGFLQRVARVLLRKGLRRSPIVFFQNKDDRRLFESLGLVRPEQARVLPGSGIDLTYFSPRPQQSSGGPVVFLFVGRLLRDKGFAEYAEAAHLVRQRHPETEFRALGAIGAENRTAIPQYQIDAWIAEGTIRYLGTTEDVRPLLAEADCVVLPSYREGSPRTLIEAAAMGRPIITTDVPGCRDVVLAGKSAFLCDVRDAKSLAEVLSSFLALRPEDREAMGRAGREYMEDRFDEQIVIAAYRELFDHQDLTVGSRRM